MLNHLSKEISTPIAIGVVLVLAVLVGGFTLWQYSEMQEEEFGGVEITLPDKKKDLVEILLDDLKDEDNRIGDVNIKKLDLSLVLGREYDTKDGKIKMEVMGVDLDSYGSPFGDYVIYYQEKEIYRENVDYRYSPPYLYSFNYGEENYIVVRTVTGGSGGTWQGYQFYVIDDSAIREVFAFEENATFTEGGDYYFLDYENYLYIISSWVGRLGVGSYQGSTEIRVLDKEGEIKNYFEFSKEPEEIYDVQAWVYPKAESLIEKSGKLYLKVANVEDGGDRYYLLANGNLIENNF